MSSLCSGHANILCIFPILTDDPGRETFTNSLGLLRVAFVSLEFHVVVVVAVVDCCCESTK